MRRAGIAILVLSLIIALDLPETGADEAAAQLLVDQGTELVSAGEIDAARRIFETALIEQTGYVPALLGLAEAELARGDHDLAMSLLDDCLDREGDAGLTRAGRAAVAKARKLYRKSDRPRLELREVLHRFIGRLLELEAGARGKDPALARRCLRRILAVSPAHAEAEKRLRELPPEAGAAQGDSSEAPASNRTELFNGKDLNGWFVDARIWKTANGAIVARPGSDPSFVECNTQLSSPATIEIELRAGGALEGGNLIGVLLSMAGPDAYAIAFLSDGFALVRQADNAVRMQKKTPYSVIPGFSPREWHTLRIEVNGGSLKASVDGTEILTVSGLADDALTGSMGLWAQRVPLEVRRVSLLK